MIDTAQRFVAEMEHLTWLAELIESDWDQALNNEPSGVIRDGVDAAWKHVKRLEGRIKEQRAQLNSIHELHADKGNIADRKRMRALEGLLGRVTLKSARRKAALTAVVDRLRLVERQRDEALAKIDELHRRFHELTAALIEAEGRTIK